MTIVYKFPEEILKSTSSCVQNNNYLLTIMQI